MRWMTPRIFYIGGRRRYKAKPVLRQQHRVQQLRTQGRGTQYDLHAALTGNIAYLPDINVRKTAAVIQQIDSFT